MTVRQLKEKLSQMPQDAEVAVSYRDDGGCYPGCDHDIEPIINDGYDRSVPDGTVLL